MPRDPKHDRNWRQDSKPITHGEHLAQGLLTPHHARRLVISVLVQQFELRRSGQSTSNQKVHRWGGFSLLACAPLLLAHLVDRSQRGPVTRPALRAIARNALGAAGKRFPVDADIKSRHTANGVLKQAGIPHDVRNPHLARFGDLRVAGSSQYLQIKKKAPPLPAGLQFRVELNALPAYRASREAASGWAANEAPARNPTRRVPLQRFRS